MSNKCNRWTKKEEEKIREQLHKPFNEILADGRSINSIKNKIHNMLIYPEFKLNKIKETRTYEQLTTKKQIIAFITSQEKQNRIQLVFYVNVFHTTKQEDILNKLECRVNMFLKLGKIENAKLCFNENNIIVYTDDNSYHHFKRDKIVNILIKKLDIRFIYNKALVIIEARENQTFYNHVLIFAENNQIEDISQLYDSIMNKLNSQNDSQRIAYIETCIGEIEVTIENMIMNKPYDSKLAFLQILHQIRRTLNLVIGDSSRDYFYHILVDFYKLHEKYFLKNKPDHDYVNALIATDTPHHIC